MGYNNEVLKKNVPRGLLGYSESISQNFSPRAQAIIDRYNYLDESVHEQRTKLSPFDYVHVVRVTAKCFLLAAHLQLNEDQTNCLVQGGLLHDSGKTTKKISDVFWSGKKYSVLDSAENELKEKHVTAKMDWMIARGVPWEVRQIVIAHHEPMYRRKGVDRRAVKRKNERRKQIDNDTQLLLQLFPVIDKTDALLNPRSYRSSVSPKACEKYLTKYFVTKLDKEIVRFLIEMNGTTH